MAEGNGGWPVQPDLFEHGIYTERSDIRAHVSPLEKTIYVFKTIEGRRAIEKYKPPLKDAYQPGVEGRTGCGWCVRPEWIVDLRPLRFTSWDAWEFYDPEWNTSLKGKFAVDCVRATMNLGRFPIWFNLVEEDDRKDIQIEGTDMLIFCKKRIQVKCDSPTVTSRKLYLQNWERNPLRRH